MLLSIVLVKKKAYLQAVPIFRESTGTFPLVVFYRVLGHLCCAKYNLSICKVCGLWVKVLVVVGVSTGHLASGYALCMLCIMNTPTPVVHKEWIWVAIIYTDDSQS